MNQHRYQNPIKGGELTCVRDPQLIQVENTYYLTGTTAPLWEGANPGVKLYSTQDFQNWKFERLLLDRADFADDVWFKDRFWAPEIHRINGKFYLTFNCRNDRLRFPHSCGIAVADDILGPYRILSHDRPLIERGNDLSLFTDDDGTTYAFWNTVNTILAQAMNLDQGLVTGRPFECIRNDYHTWDEIGIEGAYVVKREDWYYLFYSSWTRGYEVGYATARELRGPWKKHDQPIIGAMDKTVCGKRGIPYTQPADYPFGEIGHNSIFRDAHLQDWIVSHYRQLNAPSGTESLGMDRITFAEGAITVHGPTHTPQPATWLE